MFTNMPPAQEDRKVPHKHKEEDILPLCVLQKLITISRFSDVETIESVQYRLHTLLVRFVTNPICVCCI